VLPPPTTQSGSKLPSNVFPMASAAEAVVSHVVHPYHSASTVASPPECSPGVPTISPMPHPLYAVLVGAGVDPVLIRLCPRRPSPSMAPSHSVATLEYVLSAGSAVLGSSLSLSPPSR
jgi:hypothetical protein